MTEPTDNRVRATDDPARLAQAARIVRTAIQRGRLADAKPDHDYEPGDARHPMHTDPLCAMCGRPKPDHR